MPTSGSGNVAVRASYVLPPAPTSERVREKLALFKSKTKKKIRWLKQRRGVKEAKRASAGLATQSSNNEALELEARAQTERRAPRPASSDADAPEDAPVDDFLDDLAGYSDLSDKERSNLSSDAREAIDELHREELATIEAERTQLSRKTTVRAELDELHKRFDARARVANEAHKQRLSRLDLWQSEAPQRAAPQRKKTPKSIAAGGTAELQQIQRLLEEDTQRTGYDTDDFSSSQANDDGTGNDDDDDDAVVLEQLEALDDIDFAVTSAPAPKVAPSSPRLSELQHADSGELADWGL